MNAPDRVQGIVQEMLEEHIALVTINRPQARNAINAQVAAALDQAVTSLEGDKVVWVVILTGAGGAAFSAGADLKAVSASGFADLYTPQGGFAGFTKRQRKKPWIAAVEGFALAGGCEIALACDLIVAGSDAVFGLPEVSRGLIAAAGGLYRLPRAIPKAIATEIVLTAGRLSAERAEALGLINHAVAPGQAVGKAHQLAQQICANAPLAVRESLALLRLASGGQEEALQEASMEAQARLSLTDDFREGPKAFIEKRSPRWRAS